MMNKSIILLLALIIATAFAQYDFTVRLQDHTNSILNMNNLPKQVAAGEFADYAAKAMGLAPRYSNSQVPMLNTLNRAEAVVTFVTQDKSTKQNYNLAITPSYTKLTTRGNLINAVAGKDQCMLGSKGTTMDTILNTNNDSFLFSYSADEQLASTFCGSLPTTAPLLGRPMAKAVCVAQKDFVGATSVDFMNAAESNSAVAQAVNPKNEALTLDVLQTAYPDVFAYDAETVTINQQQYAIADVQAVLDDLIYITYIAQRLPVLARFANDGNVDMYTFAIISAQNVQNNDALVRFVYTVVDFAIQKFAAQYNNNMLSQVIIPTVLDENICQTQSPTLGASLLAGNETTVKVTVEDIRSYQITLWLVIALIATAISGFVATMYMHILPDPALTGGVSTSFVHKK
eukprot:UN00682